MAFFNDYGNFNFKLLFRTSNWVMPVRQACRITTHQDGCTINAKDLEKRRSVCIKNDDKGLMESKILQTGCNVSTVIWRNYGWVDQQRVAARRWKQFGEIALAGDTGREFGHRRYVRNRPLYVEPGYRTTHGKVGLESFADGDGWQMGNLYLQCRSASCTT